MQTGRPFSHVSNFTGYMKIIADYFAEKKPVRILDAPAGGGQLSDALKAQGHDVVCGDINRERENYVYVDLSRRLPFEDGEFDAVVCLEGLEHLVNPVDLIAETARVCRRGGEIVISVPNVMNLYSRLQLLFTGTPYQFNPADWVKVEPGEAIDRGHIFPISYFTLRYLYEHFGCRVIGVKGDKYKRAVLMPLYLAVIAAGWIWARRLFFGAGKEGQEQRNRELFEHSMSAPLLFSRSLIVILKKN